METEMPCPHCGQPIPTGTIICPFCRTAVVESQAWVPSAVDRRGPAPDARRRQAMIAWGLGSSCAAAAGLIGLGFWLNAINNAAAGVLISSDFLLVPVVMGLIGAFFWKDLGLTTVEYFLYSLLTTALGLVVAGVFMREGVICLVIVSPLLLCFTFLGALGGRWLFGRFDNRVNLSLVPLALAVLAFDACAPHHYDSAVTDRVLIHAPPAQVWTHLAAVPLIPDPPDFWLFRLGLPYPVQSTVSGQGVGAARRCVFSTDKVFEERITQWEPGRRLTFDVTAQPRDPEILGHARVRRGQFVLQDNHDGTTTLVGTSWYELYVYPSWYYDLWAKSIARQVHLRVMDHIKALSETPQNKRGV
jgi:uncharacterized protein YndB with AHSA1/START domain